MDWQRIDIISLVFAWQGRRTQWDTRHAGLIATTHTVFSQSLILQSVSYTIPSQPLNQWSPVRPPTATHNPAHPLTYPWPSATPRNSPRFLTSLSSILLSQCEGSDVWWWAPMRRCRNGLGATIRICEEKNHEPMFFSYGLDSHGGIWWNGWGWLTEMIK